MKRYTAFAILMVLSTIQGWGQSNGLGDQDNTKQATVLLEAVVNARGGNRFLSYKTLMATGQYTPYDKGLSQIPSPFVDIVIFPDTERIEFGKGKRKNRQIIVNVGKTGWKYDGDAETLKDQTEKEISSHLEGLEFDLDHILKSSWKTPGTLVQFTGLTELMPGERANTVKITFPTNKSALILLDRKTHLPISIVYEQTGDAGLDKWEVKFSQYIDYDTVMFPNIIDFYKNGIQISRVNYQTIKLDVKTDEKWFIKPANAKSVK